MIIPALASDQPPSGGESAGKDGKAAAKPKPKKGKERKKSVAGNAEETDFGTHAECAQSSVHLSLWHGNGSNLHLPFPRSTIHLPPAESAWSVKFASGMPTCSRSVHESEYETQSYFRKPSLTPLGHTQVSVRVQVRVRVR